MADINLNNIHEPDPVYGWVQLRAGASFDLGSGKIAERLTPRDIARSLSNICRFAGNCDKFYSVAQHSVITSYVAEVLWPFDARTQIDCLLHDIHEIVIGDITRPVAQCLLDEAATAKLLALKMLVDDALMPKFQWSRPTTADALAAVRLADDLALAVEVRQLIRQSPRWPGILGVPARLRTRRFMIEPQTPRAAENAFMFRWRQLRRELLRQVQRERTLIRAA